MIIGYLIIGLLLFSLGCYLFDDLIEYQCKNYHCEWVKDGRPRGFGFSSKRSSYFAMNTVGWRMIRGRPAWVDKDTVALKKYRRLACFNRLWFWYCLLVFPVAVIAAST